MKYLSILITCVLTLISCGKKTTLNKEFNCNTSTYTNLENIRDYKKNFTIKFPKNWKTSLYYDNVVSSIKTLDTTLTLTENTFIEASYILNPVKLNDDFITIIKSDNVRMELEEVTSKKAIFKNKNAYYNLAKGKKGKYNYHILNVFFKATDGFIHVKTEIYGDSLVNERLCKSVNLINQIKLEEL